MSTSPARVPLALLEPHMAKLPFVQWDRYISGTNYVSVFGWIPRPDGRADFALLDMTEWAEEPNFWTSSAKHSAEICRILRGESAGHVDCQRVEDAGLSIPNVVRLRPEAPPSPSPVLSSEEMLQSLRLVKRLWPKVAPDRGLGDGAEEVAALEQAIKVLESLSSPIFEGITHRWEACQPKDFAVMRLDEYGGRLGSWSDTPIAALLKAHESLYPSTQPAAAPSGPDKEEQ